VPWLSPHAELIAFGPGLVKAILAAVLAKPCVFYCVLEIFRIIGRRRSVDVLEVDRCFAGNGVLRIVRRRCVANGLGDIPAVAVDKPVDEDDSLIR
jgi:hypothetical protein